MLASYSSLMFWLNRMLSGFNSEHVVTLVPAVADGRLVNVPIFDLNFQASRCCFRFSFSLVFPPLRLPKHYPFGRLVGFSTIVVFTRHGP